MSFPATSASALRDYLITEKKFNPVSVDTFIRALKGTVEFAKLYEGGYTAPEGDAVNTHTPPPDQPDPPVDPAVIAAALAAQKAAAAPPQPGTTREVFSLDDGEAVLQWPASIGADSVDELEAWLTLMIRKMKRRAGTAPERASASNIVSAMRDEE